MRKYLLPLIFILLLTFTLIGNCVWLDGWDQRIELAIGDYAGDIGAEVVWWPATVFLTATQCEEVFVELTTDAEYLKVAFTKADGTTELYGDCELFDVSEEKGIYHVSRDGWTINANTTIYIYYDKDHVDNTTYIGLSGGTAAQSVWDGDFKAAYHMTDGFGMWSAVFDDWTDQYEATAEPDDNGWTLAGTDYASVSAGILTIDTMASNAYQCDYYKAPNIDFNAGFYLKTRIKASTDMNANDDYFRIFISDGTQDERLDFRLYNGKFTYEHSIGTGTVTVDTTTDYHIYEFYIKGTTLLIYMDEVLKDSKTIKAASADDYVRFGDISVLEKCKIEMDYFYYVLGTDYEPNDILDSTSNDNDGTKKSASEPAEATGKVGQAQHFDGSDDTTDIADSATLEPATITVEAIIKRDTIDTHDAILQKGTTADVDGRNGYYLRSAATTKLFHASIIVGNALITASSTGTIESGSYYYVAMRYDGAYVKTFINGSEDGSTEETGVIDYTGGYQNLKIGRAEASGGGVSNPFDGIIDESRVSGTARSDAWIKGTYNSLWDTLFTYGSEEEVPVVEVNVIFFGTDF